MDSELQSILQAFGNLRAVLFASGRNLFVPTSLNQIAMLLACLVGAWLLERWVGPQLYRWMKARAGWPKWRLRTAVLVHKRLRLIFFVLLAWVTAALLMQITVFPSRRYLVTLVASIATAWLLVSFAARLINNPFLRRIVTWGLWVYVTLYYLGLLAQVTIFLDQIAVAFGDFRLSALSVLKALVVTGLLLTLARVIAQTGSKRISGNPQISPSMQVLAIKVLQIGLYGAAAFIGLKAVGFDLTGLAFLSGAFGVGLGFGLQKVVSNLVSGVIILLDKSVKPGDVISLGDTFGWINSLGARYVSVVTRDGREYLIPNEDLITGQVVNWSHSDEYVRIDLFFGASYQDDPHMVRRVAVEAAATVGRVLKSRPTVCHVAEFGPSSVKYILRFWIRDPVEGLTNVRGAVYLALWDAFKQHGITIPFPQHEVRLLNPPAGSPVSGSADGDPQ